jgi:hypothetical protein
MRKPGNEKRQPRRTGVCLLQALCNQGFSIYVEWLRGQDLNLRPSGYEPDELPDCSTPLDQSSTHRTLPKTPRPAHSALHPPSPLTPPIASSAMSMFRRRRTGGETEADIQAATPASTSHTETEHTGGAVSPEAPFTTHARATEHVEHQRPIHRPPVQHPIPADTPVAPRIERALIALTSKMQHCIERLDDIEHRIDELSDTVAHVPSHSDVLEVRLHSAKLAAELARATVELRGEIGLANEETRRSARAAINNATDSTVTLPVDVEIERVERVDIDLTDRTNSAGEKPHLKGNWTQSA